MKFRLLRPGADESIFSFQPSAHAFAANPTSHATETPITGQMLPAAQTKSSPLPRAVAGIGTVLPPEWFDGGDGGSPGATHLN